MAISHRESKMVKVSDPESDKLYTIKDALSTITIGILAFAFSEYYNIKLSSIVGVIPGILSKIYFDQEGFSKIAEKKEDGISLIKDSHALSAIILMPEYDLEKLSSSKILKKFPFYKEIINQDNYDNLSQPIENIELLKRCQRMQSTWQNWSIAGLPHLISSLQALQRHIASKMKKPLLLDFEMKKENGLSVEYQCEIYSNRLYGAKLLEAWHNYLMFVASTSKEPKYFLTWLKLLSIESINEFGISSLDEIPQVHYIGDSKERSEWLLNFGPKNTIINEKIPKLKTSDEEIEIIFALGKSDSSVAQFYGGIKKRGKINHSTFFAGKIVDGAGRILLKAKEDLAGNMSWVIHEMDDNSGHIKPDDKMSLNVLERLKALGVDLEKILWTSKWGTSGASDETAGIALKRLKNELEVITEEDKILKIESTFLRKLKSYSEHGMLGLIDDLVKTQSSKVTMRESYSAAILIKEALENHLRSLGRKTAHPSMARLLASYSLKFLRNIGKYSLELEEYYQYIIKRYEGNFSFYLDNEINRCLINVSSCSLGSEKIKTLNNNTERNFLFLHGKIKKDKIFRKKASQKHSASMSYCPLFIKRVPVVESLSRNDFSLFNKFESDYVERYRHVHPKLQREYDKKFGLILKS